MEPVPLHPPHTLFQCKPDESSQARQAMALVLIGVILGLFGWFGSDRTLAFGHIAGWLAGSTAFFVTLAWLAMRNPVLSIGFDDAGLTIVRASSTLNFAWAEIEAARFWDYPLARCGGEPIRYFLLRANGKTIELMP